MKSLIMSLFSLTLVFGSYVQSAYADGVIEGGMFTPASFNPQSVRVTNVTRWEEGTNVAEVELSLSITTNACGGVQFVGFVQDYEASGNGVKAFIPLESPMTGGCADVVGSQNVKQKILVSMNPQKGTKVIKIGKYSYSFNGTSVELLN